MNPNRGEGQKQVLSREEIIKGFRRLGDGGFAKCIADLRKCSFFPKKVPPHLGQGLNPKEIFMDEVIKVQHFNGGASGTCRVGNVDRFLEVTIIDDPHYVYPNIILIEDKKKNVGVLLVDDMDSAHAPGFQFGAVLRIENVAHSSNACTPNTSSHSLWEGVPGKGLEIPGSQDPLQASF